MHLDADARLAAAAGGAVRYFADAAGLEHDAVAQLQNAVIAACAEAFEETGGDQGGVDVTLTWLVDRIEVAVAHRTVAEKSGGAHPSSAASHSLEGVDDVQHETRDSTVVTRLTKFIKQGAASR